jgi:hypothetical protein
MGEMRDARGTVEEADPLTGQRHSKPCHRAGPTKRRQPTSPLPPPKVSYRCLSPGSGSAPCRDDTRRSFSRQYRATDPSPRPPLADQLNVGQSTGICSVSGGRNVGPSSFTKQIFLGAKFWLGYRANHEPVPPRRHPFNPPSKGGNRTHRPNDNG